MVVGTIYATRVTSELALFVVVGAGGYQLGREVADSLVVGVVAGALAVGVAVLCWGRWVAPRAGARLDDPLRFGLEVCLFAWGASAILMVDWPAVVAAAAFALAVAAAVAIRVVGEPVPPAIDPADDAPTR